jgi:hypothetical protein
VIFAIVSVQDFLRLFKCWLRVTSVSDYEIKIKESQFGKQFDLQQQRKSIWKDWWTTGEKNGRQVELAYEGELRLSFKASLQISVYLFCDVYGPPYFQTCSVPRALPGWSSLEAVSEAPLFLVPKKYINPPYKRQKSRLNLRNNYYIIFSSRKQKNPLGPETQPF